MISSIEYKDIHLGIVAEQLFKGWEIIHVFCVNIIPAPQKLLQARWGRG